MQPAVARAMLDKLSGLRTELIDLAFVLDGRGACEAADVAITTAARIAELSEELSSPNPAGQSPADKIDSAAFKRTAADLL